MPKLSLSPALDFLDLNIITAVASKDRLWVSLSNSSIRIMTMNIEDNRTFYKLDKLINTEKPISRMIIDEKLNLLFCLSSDSMQIFIFNLDNGTCADEFCDGSNTYVNFKCGRIDLGSEILTFSLDVKFHRISLQTKEGILFIFSYGDGNHRNFKMNQVFSQIFKRMCTMIFVCGDFLVVHFEGKPKLHLFKMESSLIRISTGSIWPDIKYHLPQMIYLTDVDEKHVCLLKWGKKAIPVCLDGSVMQNALFCKVRLSYKTTSQIAMSFPYIAGINTKPTTQIEFRNLFFLRDDSTEDPIPIRDVKDPLGIISSVDRFYILCCNKIIPIVLPRFKMMREALYLDNLEEYVDIIEQVRGVADLDVLGKKTDQIKAYFRYGKFTSAFNTLSSMLDKKLDLREILCKFTRFSDDLALTQEPLVPIEFELPTNIPLLQSELICPNEQKTLSLYRAENALLEYLEYIRDSMESDQHLVDYCLLFFYLQRCKSDLTVFSKLMKLIKGKNWIVLGKDSAFLSLFRKSHQRFLALLYGYRGMFEESLKILWEILISFQSRGETVSDIVEVLSMCQDWILIEKYGKIVLSEDPVKAVEIFTRKRNELSFRPKSVMNMLKKEQIDQYCFFLVEKEGHTSEVYKSLSRQYMLKHITMESYDTYRLILQNHIFLLKSSACDAVFKEFQSFDILYYEQSLLLRRVKKYQQALQILRKHGGGQFVEELLMEIQDVSLVTYLLREEVLIFDAWFEIGVFYIKAHGIPVEVLLKTPKLLETFFKKFGFIATPQFDQICSVCKGDKSRYKCRDCFAYVCDKCISNTDHFRQGHQFCFSKIQLEKLEKIEQDSVESTLVQRRMILDKRKKARVKQDIVTSSSPLTLVTHSHSPQDDIDCKSPMPLRNDYVAIETKHRAPLNKGFTNHKINFFSVFTVSEMKDAFMNHLKVESNTIPFEFVLEVLSLQEHDFTRFEEIRNMYISESGEKSVNISGAVRSLIMSHDIKNWTSNMTPLDALTPAKNAIVSDLKFDAFPRFIHSELGYATISQNLDNLEIVSSSPVYVLTQKLIDTFSFENSDQMKEVAEDLSDHKRLAFKYLNTKWTETLKVHQKIGSSFEGGEMGIRLEDSPLQKNLTNLRIKIILLDKKANPLEKLKRTWGAKFLSPIISQFPGFDQPEGCYTALMIGPYLLTWDEQSLCVPKKTIAMSALMTADLKAIFTIKNLEMITEPLAKIITEWNVSRNYDPRNANSQLFVESVLNAIGVKYEVPRPFEEIFKTIREKGTSELMFQPSSEFRKSFQIRETKIVFINHTQLDDFVRSLKNIDGSFEKKWINETDLLKSFDRTFWIRFYDQASDSNRQCDCPFMDPTLTNSFIYL